MPRKKLTYLTLHNLDFCVKLYDVGEFIHRLLSSLKFFISQNHVSLPGYLFLLLEHLGQEVEVTSERGRSHPLVAYQEQAFPRFKNSHFQNEAKYKTFLAKMNFICMRIKNRYHINSFALSLALKQKLEASWKWPIHFLMCLSRLLRKPIIKNPAFFPVYVGFWTRSIRQEVKSGVASLNAAHLYVSCPLR